jgi:peptidyl-tRNA hydrolase
MEKDKPAAQLEGALLQGVFSGRTDFQQLIRSALAQAAKEGWREMVWFDLNYADWPLGERSVEASLQAWSETGRKLTIVAKRFDTLIATHHRFVAWRKQWSHIIEARGVTSASDEEFPSLILSPTWAMQRLQPALCKGVAGYEPKRRVDLRELTQEWLAISSPSFPSTTLGL